ncbi:MAG: PIN domain-containing protein [bacterium]|nr:PIN domain-containing protein [bacterium]
MERVYPDTNVLYPISVADLTLRLGDIFIHEVVWSADLLDEVDRVLVDYKGLTADQAAYFCDCIRSAFPDGYISKSDYEHLISSRTGPDPDDYVHSAAVASGAATVLLTSNTDDFPTADLGDARRLTPDTYFIEVLDEHADEVLAVLEDMGSSRREPQTIDQTLSALERAGLPAFTAKARALLQ